MFKVVNLVCSCVAPQRRRLQKVFKYPKRYKNGVCSLIFCHFVYRQSDTKFLLYLSSQNIRFYILYSYKFIQAYLCNQYMSSVLKYSTFLITWQCYVALSIKCIFASQHNKYISTALSSVTNRRSRRAVLAPARRQCRP